MVIHLSPSAKKSWNDQSVESYYRNKLLFKDRSALQRDIVKALAHPPKQESRGHLRFRAQGKWWSWSLCPFAHLASPLLLLKSMVSAGAYETHFSQQAKDRNPVRRPQRESQACWAVWGRGKSQQRGAPTRKANESHTGRARGYSGGKTAHLPPSSCPLSPSLEKSIQEAIAPPTKASIFCFSGTTNAVSTSGQSSSPVQKENRIWGPQHLGTVKPQNLDPG